MSENQSIVEMAERVIANSEGTCAALAREVLRLTAENAKLREALPKTADGALLTEGMKVWHRSRGDHHVTRIIAIVYLAGMSITAREEDLFSTQSAALAPEGEKGKP